MGCLKLLNNSNLFAIASGRQYQSLAVAYNREWLLDERINNAHGNMLSMPHLSLMQWDFADRLKSASNGTFASYYNYDISGERSRKVVIKGNIREERYYIGAYEVFRKYVNNSLDTERTTLHVMDDTKTVALIETDTLQSTVTVRYQYDNHLGSACLELDQNAGIISYEEYHPFGTTSYRSGRTETEVSLKRYKYVGKERDEETGLYYYGARYYAAWLCRFVSVDPLQHEYPQLTPFNYAGNKPITHIDIDGMQGTGDEKYKIEPKSYHEKHSGDIDNSTPGKFAWNTYAALHNIVFGTWNQAVDAVNLVDYNIKYAATNGPKEYANAVIDYWSKKAIPEAKEMLKGLSNLTPQDVDNFLSSPQGFELLVGIAATKFSTKLSKGSNGKIKVEPIENKTNNLNSVSESNIINKEKQLGGAYKDLKITEIQERHHMPSQASGNVGSNSGAIIIEKNDHYKTASWGRSNSAKKYQSTQKILVEKGKFNEAFMLDINDIKAKFGNRYNAHIDQLINYYKSKGLIK